MSQSAATVSTLDELDNRRRRNNLDINQQPKESHQAPRGEFSLTTEIANLSSSLIDSEEVSNDERVVCSVLMAGFFAKVRIQFS